MCLRRVQVPGFDSLLPKIKWHQRAWHDFHLGYQSLCIGALGQPVGYNACFLGKLGEYLGAHERVLSSCFWAHQILAVLSLLTCSAVEQASNARLDAVNLMVVERGLDRRAK